MTEEFVKAMCKPGRGAETCRYLGMGAGGWRCLKFTTLREYIDNRAASGSLKAMGDNCPGLSDVA